jgi:lipopolysaccharide transport system ATP-binding protein
MTSPIIEVNGIGKRYTLAHQKGGGYLTLRDILAGAIRKPFELIGRGNQRAGRFETKEEFWALRGVDISINRGDVVGIIGANGAGKSTLLKILTGITPPTEGEIILGGRVASLLEVGTGFHPELSGRDNIFLNGAILGMARREIARKFDEIVEFAGVSRFLDTPVKYYSSGMYVRLAFSVAAHLEPDILLVDEVLAVGDVEFQKKCLGKMEEVTRTGGRTILFVSHNMGAIQELCTRCVMLESGTVVKQGTPAEVIDYYMSRLKREVKELILEEDSSLAIQIVKMRLEDEQGRLLSDIDMGNDAVLKMDYVTRHPIPSLSLSLEISKDGVPLLYSLSSDADEAALSRTAQIGRYCTSVTLPTSLLKEGSYRIDIGAGDAAGELKVARGDGATLIFSVINTRSDLTQKSYRRERKGLLYKHLVWENKGAQ